MTETASISAEDAASARALEQARLRKERREAKIKAGGASRLDRITGLGGGVPKAPPPAPPSTEIPPTTTTPSAPTVTTQATSRPQVHADPEEVDISQHFYTPQTTQRIPRPASGPSPGPGPAGNDMSDAQLRQLMLGLDQPSANGGSAANPDEDPMLNMLMQMLGGGGGAGGLPFSLPGSAGGSGANPFANLASLAGQPGAPGAPATGVVPDRYASLWRLLHTAVALGLGLYIALWTSFSGTKAERERGAVGTAEAEMAESARKFFYAFATAEAVLLTTRYFMDRGRASAAGGGLMGALMGFLPPPVKGYVEMGMRYAQIFGTVRSDVLVCIFVLGVCSWLRS